MSEGVANLVLRKAVQRRECLKMQRAGTGLKPKPLQTLYTASCPRCIEDHGNYMPTIALLMGSASDWDTLRPAADLLAEFGVDFEARVVSAHRMPDDLFAYAEGAESAGVRAIIAGAGGAAHLPG